MREFDSTQNSGHLLLFIIFVLRKLFIVNIFSIPTDLFLPKKKQNNLLPICNIFRFLFFMRKTKNPRYIDDTAYATIIIVITNASLLLLQ